MTARDLLQYASARGVSLSLGSGDLIEIDGPSPVVVELADAIRANKAELSALLSTEPPPLSPADLPSWRWEIRHADGARMIHMVIPFETLTQIRAAYPDAMDFRPTHLAQAAEDAA